MQEEWRDISGYEGLYQVSNTGKVCSMNYRKSGKPRELAQSDVNGYRVVGLSKASKQKAFAVHTLVAQQFIGERPDNHEVHHKNAIRSDNNVSNLEYVTASVNSQHRVAMRDEAAKYRDPSINNTYFGSSSERKDSLLNLGTVAKSLGFNSPQQMLRWLSNQDPLLIAGALKPIRRAEKEATIDRWRP